MRNIYPLLFCILVLFGVTNNTKAQGAKKSKSTTVIIPLNWYEIHQDSTLRSTFFNEEKIDKNKLVYLKVTNYNFIRYDLDHEVQEEVIESYRILENLWDQVFSYIPATRAPADTAINEFLQILKKWQQNLADREQKLQNYLENFSDSVHVMHEEKEQLKDKIEDPATDLNSIGVGIVKDLEALRLKTEALIFNSDNIAITVFDTITVEEPKDNTVIAQIPPIRRKTTSKNTATDAYYASILYDKQLQIHEKVVHKFKAFFAAGRKTYRGTRIKIGKKDSGTLVTITLTPVGLRNKNLEIAKNTQPVSVQYFVESDKPVLFHVGYSLTFLKDNEFEKMRASTGNDVFTLIRDEDYSLDLSAFLSYELLKSNDAERSLGITLGTDIISPGAKIYIGSSVKLFDRLFFTIAAATSEMIEGINEQSSNSEIKLYESIKTTRDWGIVFAISLNPF